MKPEDKLPLTFLWDVYQLDFCDHWTDVEAAEHVGKCTPDCWPLDDDDQMNRLKDAGLVEWTDDGFWRIHEAGLRALEGVKL